MPTSSADDHQPDQRHPGGGARTTLVGILTNRDVRFANDPNQPVYELMTRENLVTVTDGVSPEEARRLLHRHRIEKLLVVDDAYRCVGLITVKDMDKAETHPLANKDELGRLRVAAATGVGRMGMTGRRADRGGGGRDRGRHRARALARRAGRGGGVKQRSNAVQVIAGNIATPEGALALIEAGAEA